MAYVERPDPAPSFGFRTYADGTPRFQTFDEPAADEYDAFDEGDASDRDEAPPEASDLPHAGLRWVGFLAAGLAIALAAFVATVLIRQHWRPTPRTAPSPAVVAQPLPQSLPKAQLGEAKAFPDALTPPATDRSAVSPTAASPAPIAAASRKGRPMRKSVSAGLSARLDCARPASPAQRLVCRSPDLLAADRRMKRAYARAKIAGAPPGILRRDQVRFLAAREAAARRSRSAVESLYSDRIWDLESRPYRGCAGYAAVSAQGRLGLGSVGHWILSVPRKIVSPRGRSRCG